MTKILEKLYTRGLFTILFILFFGSTLFAQNPMRGRGGQSQTIGIEGVIVDANTNHPMEYVTILLFNKSDSIQVGGASTNEQGWFSIRNVRNGQYYLTLTFIGYEIKVIDNIELNSTNNFINFNQIQLNPTTVTIEGIEVQSERAPIEYKIDKKVINVDKQLTATSGNAIDILQNAPSITVDIEGNVKLRGSSNFTVYIDGRPSVLDANEALEQIPASSIDNIEIITNPSAKYDPDGTSGIINVILKKNKLVGISGIINSNGGSNSRYGSDALITYRKRKYNSYISLVYNRRNRPGTYYSENISTINNVTSYLNSDGIDNWQRIGVGGRGGIDYLLTDNDNLSFGLRYGNRDMERTSELGFVEWSNLDQNELLYSSSNNSERSGHFYAINSDYKHNFTQKNHEFSAQFIFSRSDMKEIQTNRLYDTEGIQTSGIKQFEEGPSNRFRTKLDYIRPIKHNGKIEIGYQSRFGKANDLTRQLEYNPISRLYEDQPEYSHNTEYTRNIHSLYFMFSNEINKLGYQFGLRGEYTYRDIVLLDQSSNFKIDRWDYYPTVHFSYRFKEGQQIMTSYSRRTMRTRGWYLEPFLTWRDPFNVRIGNPDLKPQFINSFELGYQQFIDRNLFSVETYYRITENKIEFLRSVYDENVTLLSVENIGKDYAFGTEFMFNFNQLNFLDMSIMVNLYNYRIKGNIGTDYNSEDFTWDARINSNFKLNEKTRLQIINIYHSSSVTSQGKSDGSFTTNIALKKDFFKRMFSATLQVDDIFSGHKHESTSTGVDFYNYTLSERDSPTIMLNVSYNFNNYKPERKKEGNGTDYSEDDF